MLVFTWLKSKLFMHIILSNSDKSFKPNLCLYPTKILDFVFKLLVGHKYNIFFDKYNV